MPLATCPTCRKQFDSASSAVRPFCSVRCQQIDLGRWLEGRYTVPGKPIDDLDEPLDLPPPADEEDA